MKKSCIMWCGLPKLPI